jgi:sugar phosphate isomerase/epimerase
MLSTHPSSRWIHRRTLLTAAGASLLATKCRSGSPGASPEAASGRPSLCLFSKHLEWITDPAQLAETLADIGFEGADLTVRNDGHIDPPRVEEELPRFDEALRKAGLRTSMITTRIDDARKPETRKILKTASALGIRYYRRGGENWGNGRNPLERIRELHPKIRDLVALNQEYGMLAGIHNHSGYGLAAAIWDLYELVKPFDARYIGSNYDIGHATAEGGYGAWRSGFRLLAADSRIRMIAVKDFLWRKRDEGWRPGFCPIGQGMVDFKTFFGYLKEIGFAGPISLHFEYSSGGSTPTEKQKNQIADMKRDLAWLRNGLKESGVL